MIRCETDLKLEAMWALLYKMDGGFCRFKSCSMSFFKDLYIRYFEKVSEKFS